MELHDLPEELLFDILSHLDVRCLAFVIDTTCRKFRRVAESIYGKVYRERGPSHRTPHGRKQWKRLALEEDAVVRKGQEPGWTPAGALEQLLEEHYQLLDTEFADWSARCIIFLRNSKEKRTASWLEALATALMAQRRHEEAAVAYGQFLQLEHTLPESTVFTAARFGWPDTFPSIPTDISVELKEKALIGAAISCNHKVYLQLENEGVNAPAHNSNDKIYNLATIAAGVGNLQLLEHLHQRQFDVIGPDHHPLIEAAQYDEVEAARYLLLKGGRPDYDHMERTPFDMALSYGSTGVLQLFFDHSPHLLEGQYGDGSLVTRKLAENDWIEHEHLIVGLKFLVEAMHLDLDIGDHSGNTLSHLAAKHGHRTLLSSLHERKINLLALNDLGQTPQDLATADYPEIAVWLADLTEVECDVECTRRYAANIIASRYFTTTTQWRWTSDSDDGPTGDVHVQRSVAQVQAVWSAYNMDDKLSQIYLRAFSSDTLKQWSEMLEDKVDSILLNFTRVCEQSSSLVNGVVDHTYEEAVVQTLIQHLMTKLLDKRVPPVAAMEISHALIRKMEDSDLVSLAIFLNTTLGKRIARGLSAIHFDTVLVHQDFRKHLQRSLSPSRHNAGHCNAIWEAGERSFPSRSY